MNQTIRICCILKDNQLFQLYHEIGDAEVEVKLQNEKLIMLIN